MLCYRFSDKDVPAGVFTGTVREGNGSRQEGEIAAHREGPGGKQCAKNTAGTYETGWKRWMQFARWIVIDQLLRDQPSDWVSDGIYTYKEEIWISFIGWLFHDENLNPGSVRVYLAAVRFVFLNRGVEISFLRSACVKAARSATYLLWRATHPDEKSRVLPISMDMIMDGC